MSHEETEEECAVRMQRIREDLKSSYEAKKGKRKIVPISSERDMMYDRLAGGDPDPYSSKLERLAYQYGLSASARSAPLRDHYREFRIPIIKPVTASLRYEETVPTEVEQHSFRKVLKDKYSGPLYDMDFSEMGRQILKAVMYENRSIPEILDESHHIKRSIPDVRVSEADSSKPKDSKSKHHTHLIKGHPRSAKGMK